MTWNDDILPASHTARTIAAFHAAGGQFYVAVADPPFVGMCSSQPRR